MLWLEDAVYGCRFDGSLKNSVRNDKSVEEALAVEDFQEVLDKIEEQAEADKTCEKALHISDVEDHLPELPAPVAEVCRLSIGSAEAQKLTETDVGERELLSEFTSLAARMVAERIKLVDGKASETTLADIIRESAVGKVRGDASGSAVIVYDTKLSGEDKKRPALRPPVVRKPHLDKMVRAVLRSRLSPTEPLRLSPGDVSCMCDGGRDAHHLLMSAFVVPEGANKTRAPHSDSTAQSFVIVNAAICSLALLCLSLCLDTFVTVSQRGAQEVRADPECRVL